jgi:hypothetical protein
MVRASNVTNEDVLKWMIIIAGAVVALIFIFYFAFQFFRILTFISLFVLLVAIIHDIYIHFQGNGYEEYWSIYPLVALIASFLLSVIFFGLYLGLAGSTIGQFSTQFWGAFIGMEKAISDSQEQAISSLVNSTCLTVDESSCNLIKTSVNTMKTTQEAQDWIEKMEMAGKIVKKIQT